MDNLIYYFKRILPVIFVFLFLVNLNGCNTGVRKEFFGAFYANDCGESHGGFEWAGEYTASLVIVGTRGDLSLTFSIGLGDYLTKHQFSVSEFAEVGGNLSFKIEGSAAVLVLVEEDTIWNGKYDDYLSANKSSNESEQIGILPIEPFSGYSSHFYIELRLKSAESQSGFFPFN